MNDKTTIFTPIFEGTRYLHHVCSECEGEIKFEQSIWGGVQFYEIYGGSCEKMKFCPLCGAEIIRFSDKPIYKKPLDLKPLNIFADLHREYECKAKWLYNCYISDEHRNKIDKLIPLLESGEISVYYQKAIDLATDSGATRGITYQTRKKLIKEFGDEREK